MQERLAERYPYYLSGTIPAGAYPGVEVDIPTVAVMNWIVGTAELEGAVVRHLGAVVRHLLNVLEDQREQLIQVSAIANQIDLEALQTAPIPLHPAAQRWWAERGR
jgi:TRAP-type uncharacterized transport system substrate-binding protein